MIRVYTESNLLLEMVRMQEQHSSAGKLVEFAEAGRIELCLPEFSLAEPFATLNRYRNERNRFSKSFDRLLRDLSRSEDQQLTVQNHAALVQTLIQVSRAEQDRMSALVRRLLIVATTLPLKPGTFDNAVQLSSAGDIPMQDAIIFSIILADLHERVPELSAFVTRNARDFQLTKPAKDLPNLNCRIISGYDQALQFVQSNIRNQALSEDHDAPR